MPAFPATAADALARATLAGDLIHVPSICLVEVTYLIEKRRLPRAARDRLINTLDDTSVPCSLAPLDRAIADALELVSRHQVPDLPDRVVAATAIALRAPLISRDRKIATSNVQTIW